MKRTQVYLENDVWTVLQVRAKESHSTISELVRTAVREKYLDKASHRKRGLASGSRVVGRQNRHSRRENVRPASSQR